MRRRTAALLFGMSLAAAGPALASHPKTDVVTLDNGDRFHGEIKEVQQGSLTLKTDNAGTLSVKWEHVVRLVSEYAYEVQATTGGRYFGSLGEPGEKGQLRIVGASATHDLPLDEVFWIAPIGRSFFDRVDGSVSLGFTYTQSNDAVQYSLSADSQYLSRKVSGDFQLSSSFNQTGDADSASQQNVSLNMWRPLGAVGGKLTLFGIGQVQSNPSQGYDLRSIGGGGMGLYLRQMSRGFTLINAGLVVDRELVTDSSDVNSDVQVLLGLRYSRYRNDFPKYNIYLSMDTFTYLTDSPRFRTQTSFKLSFEVIHSFTVSFNVLNSYDSRPPTEDAATNDLQVTSSLGYTF